MDSKYAYVHYLAGIDSVDQNVRGELVQSNYATPAGQTDLVSVAVLQRLLQDFPDRIKGAVIKQDNLMNMLNLLYSQLKDEINSLPEVDDYTMSRLANVQQFEIGGVLRPDHDTEASINDLANKVFNLQEQVRKAQRERSNGFSM